MSTPGEGDGPRYDPYSQRGQQQGAPGQQGAYGSPPPYGQPGQYAYNPYSSSPYPAGLGESETQPVRRPRIMVLSLILLVLSTLIFLLFGVVFLVAPLDAATLDRILAQLPAQQVNSEQLIQVIRIVGGVFVAAAVLYIVFAVLAFLGRNWARIVVTVLTVGFVLLLAGGLANGAGADATSLTLVLAIMVAAIAGTAIMYLPEPRRYFAAPRR